MNTTLAKNRAIRHRVTWIREFPRTHFTQAALFVIGSAMSFFQIRNFADEYLEAVERKDSGQPTPSDETVAMVTSEIIQNTRDFIQKQLEQELKGHGLASLVGQLLETMGYRVRVSPPGPDAGIDIIAHKDELGFEPPLVKVQVKSGAGNVGHPELAALYGNVGTDEFGLLVTLSGFTNQAQNFARGKSNLRLIDGEELVDLVLEHYEHLDPRYQGLIPLARVYVPETLDEPET